MAKKKAAPKKGHMMPGGMMMSDSEMKGMMNGSMPPKKMPMKGKKSAARKGKK